MSANATAPKGPTRTMKAMIQHAYGSPEKLSLQEIKQPAVSDAGVLVRVGAASVNPLDWHLVRGLPYLVRWTDGLRAPKIPVRGVDVAGQVVAVGRNVTQFRPGDKVFGLCRAAFAEYVCGTERSFAPLPAGLTFEQAAAVPLAGLAALQALRDAGALRAGEQVLINGASGGVGTFAVQIAKAWGTEATGVCSARHVDLVRSLGADHVVDYTRADFTRAAARYDVILDTIGNRSVRDLRHVLGPRGILVLVGAGQNRWVGPFARAIGVALRSHVTRQRLVSFFATFRTPDLLVLRDLLEAGKVRPVIDRTYPLSEAVQAIRYLETGHAGGKVVVTVSPL